MARLGLDKTAWQLRCRLRGVRPMNALKTMHNAVVAVEPWGILVVAVSLFVTLSEVTRERHVREASFRVMALDRAQAARIQDEKMQTKEPEADAGQIVVLESMVTTGMSLDRLDLTDIYLRGAKLPGAELGDANLSCSFLVEADLSGATLSGSAVRVVFFGADLSGADFSGANMSESAFAASKTAPSSLTDVDFRKADLQRAVFRGVALDGADFSEATLEGTWFWKVDLSGARGLEPDQLKEACVREVVGLPERLHDQARQCNDLKVPKWFGPLCDLEARRQHRNEPASELRLRLQEQVPVEISNYELLEPLEEIELLELPMVDPLPAVEDVMTP